MRLFYNLSKHLLASLFLLLISMFANAQALVGGTTYAINGTSSSSSFISIQSAASYVATNGITGTGNVILQLQTGYSSSSEPSTGIFMDSVPGANSTRGIIIRPATGFSVTISGSVSAAGLLNLRNCSYYTIDGRQGGTGSTGLTFSNTSSSTSDTTCTIRFMNGASNNAIRYCLLQGASKSINNGGVVLFSVGNSYSGNNYNTIESCNIDGTSNTHNNICSNGSMTSPSVENTSDTIRNNSIYDYFDNAGTTGNVGIHVFLGANAWYISGNSVYQTATRTYSLNNLHYGILIGDGGYYTSDSHIITGNYIGGSAASCSGMLTYTASTGVLGFAGIYMYMGNNSTVSNNTIKNISVTYSSASGTYSNAGIYSFLKYGGTVNITNNTIDTTSYSNNASTTAYFAIYLSTALDTTFIKNITPTFNITNNSVKNVTLSSTLSTANTQLFGIRVAATSTTNQGSGSNYYNNTVVVATGNTIDGLRSNGTNISSYAMGIQGNATNAASTTQSIKIYPTVSNNIIRNIYSNGTIISTGNPSVGGVIFVNSISGAATYGDTIKVRNNTIYNLYAQNNSDLNTAAGAIFVNGGKVDISKNKIYNIYNAGYASTNNPFVFGVELYSLPSTSSSDNNFISLGDTATSNQAVYGIINALNLTTPVNLYNNTILISGSSTNKNSAAILRGDPLAFTGNATPLVVKNNLLINRRTGGGVNVSIAMPGTSSFTSDNNTLLDSLVGYYNTSVLNFSNWKSTTINDEYSYNGAVSTTTDFTASLTKISLADLFANSNYSSAANLLIDNTKTTCWMLFGKGVSLTGYGLDFNSASRSTTTGVPICIGANEFATSTTPPNNSITGNYATNDSVTASFAGRKVLRIIWGTPGTLPTSITSAYFSGKSTVYPPGDVSASFWTAPATGGSGYTYSVKVFYGPHEKGTVNNSNAGLIYRYTAGFGNPFGSADTTQYPQVAYVAGRSLALVASAAFSLSDYINPTPVKLLDLTATKMNKDIRLDWSTASEINNNYFSVQRSFDGSDFTAIGNVKGAVNSNTLTNYMFPDQNAQSLNQPVIFYRLKQVDMDGKFSYSNIVKVEFNSKDERVVAAIPNPFTDKLSVSFNTAEVEPVTIKIINMNGQVVFERLINTAIGVNSISLDEAADLSEGVYFVNLIFRNEVSTTKVLKLKN